MTLHDVLSICATIIASLGGGGLIVFGLSNFLGKVWADRLMQKERAQHERQLEGIRTIAAKQLAELQAEHTRRTDTHGQVLRERLAVYKEAILPLADLSAHIWAMQKQPTGDQLLEFEKKRLYVTAMVGMLSKAAVFNAYNALLDYVYDSLDNKVEMDFKEFRRLSLNVVSEMRKDIGIHKDDLSYIGSRL